MEKEELEQLIKKISEAKRPEVETKHFVGMLYEEQERVGIRPSWDSALRHELMVGYEDLDELKELVEKVKELVKSVEKEEPWRF